MKSGSYRLESVVLGRVNYSEADLVVSFLTRERGKVSGLAKHGRKSVKRFGNVLVPGTVAEMAFKVSIGRDLVRLDSGDLVRSFDGLGGDPRLLGLAGLGLEMAEAFCAPLDPAPETYDLLLWYLDRLDRNERPDEAAFQFQLRFLGLAGFGPNLDVCGVCGKSIEAVTGAALNLDQSGLVCSPCAPGGFPVSPGTVKIMALVRSIDTGKLDRVRTGGPAMSEAGPFLLAYVRHILGRELKTARYLEQISRRG